MKNLDNHIVWLDLQRYAQQHFARIDRLQLPSEGIILVNCGSAASGGRQAIPVVRSFTTSW